MVVGRRSKRRLFLFTFICSALLLSYLYVATDLRLSWSVAIDVPYPILVFGDSDSEQRSFVVSTTGCRIPSIDPFNDLIRLFIKKVDLEDLRAKCGTLPPLTLLQANVESRKVQVLVNATVLDLYGVEDEASFVCKATAILTDVDGVNMDDYRYAAYSRSFNITSGLDVVEDHLRIQCYYEDTLIYTDFYATIQIHPELEERCDKRFRNSEAGGKDGQDRLSVLILTLDSVSRVNVHRHMPRTAEYLRDTLGAIEMLGYNKLGDNTFPIIVTFLMGLSADQVNSKCSSSRSGLDKCPFIWKEFSEHGYRTAYGEDAEIIQAFYMGQPGFRKQPTDYYLRPTMKAEYESVERTEWNPDDYYCFAKRIQTPVLIEYARDFAAAMKNRPHFGYFHTSGLTHDDMNWAQLLDPMVYDFLEEGHVAGYFNNTVLMLMSDHGARFGSIRETYIGKLEESLPVLYLIFPPWFVRKHPNVMRNLAINSRRLVSSYDIHETLRDILHARYGGSSSSSSASSSSKAPSWQLPDRMSLFDEIPGRRTCSSANIPEHYCACQTVELVSNDTRDAVTASKDVVMRVNELTQTNRHMCAEYSVDYVLRIYALKPTTAFTADRQKLASTIMDYTVVVTAKPGSAQFEGTVRFQGGLSTGVLGDISRINRYGNTSACVNDTLVKKYCWCQNTTKVRRD